MKSTKNSRRMVGILCHRIITTSRNLLGCVGRSHRLGMSQESTVAKHMAWLKVLIVALSQLLLVATLSSRYFKRVFEWMWQPR